MGLSNNSKTTEANLTKLHRKIEHNEKVCRTQELGSYAQCQGHNYVRGQIVPKIVLLINYYSSNNKGSEVKYFLCDYLNLAEAHFIKLSKKVNYN